jgi:TaqI-like C-terminal specificity domain/Eco57I restriction-modification methylase
MDRHQATALVAEVFAQRFDEIRFRHFLRNLVNHLDESNRQQFSGSYVKRAFAEQVGHYIRLGTYTDPRGDRVDCLAIYLRKETTLARGRVTLRNFVADYLSTGHGRGKAAVVAAFVSPTEEDWRFSFVKLDFTLETTELGFVTERAQLTPARRYSYLVGKNETCHTAQKQFLELLETDHADPTIPAIEAAFSIEKVTRDFFEHYRVLFEKTRGALSSYLGTESAISNEFEKRGITCDDFAKKLLGQIVFLYFLQKKGWFGVQRGRPWGSGRKDFIRHIFEHRTEYSRAQRTLNFFNDILEPLFYEALASPRLDDDHYYSRFDCRIPFLNGGLFEPLYGYNWVETDVLLPDVLFSNDEVSKEGDTGTGILDVFDRYNFTVNEAEPLEKEVAVDPEMLGKVFENLLPENIRHSSGTYYTPRVVVHYMCQQALLSYLAARTPEISNGEIEVFLRFAERFADFEEVQTENHADKRLPDIISRNAAKLDDLLANVTVCDPAIGSGAFPVGMMHEIVRARMALTPVVRRLSPDREPSRSAYALKRHAIQHCLYGVDYDPGAVEIAKLRLWLSMVVDEDEIKEIQPLPNLDFKVMQGNSLLEEYDGVRLLDDGLLRQEDWGDSASRLLQIDDELKSVQQKLSELQANDQLTPKAIQELKDMATALNRERRSILDRERIESKQVQLSLGSRGSLRRIQQLHAEFFDEASRVKKEALRAEMESLEWEFMRATLREQGREEALVELEHASAKHRKPYFLWKLHFAEVFQARTGFDVVIANPPFVRMEIFKEQKPSLKRRFPHLFTGRADLYVFFFGIGLEILRDNGCLVFVSSNTYLNAQFGEPLRKYLLSETTVATIIDFAETKVFDAVVEPAIIVLQKSKVENARTRFLKWPEGITVEELPEVTAKRAQFVPQTSFSGEPWRLIGGVESQLLSVLNRGRRLGTIASDGILYGVKTGLNEAFIIDNEKRIELCKDTRAEEVIKPFVRGRDIGRWIVHPIEAWLIYTYHGIDIDHYPSIKRHLAPFMGALKRRATRQEWFELQQPQFRYSKLFAKPKVIYQDISRGYAFSYDSEGAFCGDTTFVLPTSSLAILGVLQSNAIKWWAHTDQGVPFGGFLRLKTQYMERCPIPSMTPVQESILSQIVEYLIWIHKSSFSGLKESYRSGEILLAGYFEQWVNALVYELFLPDKLHDAGLHFFDISTRLHLCPLAEMEGAPWVELRTLFEDVYRAEHPLRQSLFSLSSIEEIRIIEGEA